MGDLGFDQNIEPKGWEGEGGKSQLISQLISLKIYYRILDYLLGSPLQYLFAVFKVFARRQASASSNECRECVKHVKNNEKIEKTFFFSRRFSQVAHRPPTSFSSFY